MKWLLLFCSLLPASAFSQGEKSVHIASPIQPKNLSDFWLGLYFSHQIQRRSKVIEDHPDHQRVMDVFTRIQDQGGKGVDYSITIIKANVANAFALPGGFLFITDKLLELDLSDAELAFLIGHELCHVQKNHFERLQKERTKVSFINALTTIGAVLLAHQDSKNNSRERERLQRQGSMGRQPSVIHDHSHSQQNLPPHLAPLIAGNLFGTLYLLHSQRDYEFEADLGGARLSMQAGYPLEKGIGMLEKLFYTNYRNASYEIWTTHPLTQSRMMSVKSKVDHRWLKTPKADIFVKERQHDLADRFLDLYEQLPLWPRPNFIPKGSAQKLRPLLRQRAEALSSSPFIQRRALRLELHHELIPQNRHKSALLADHGHIYQKWLTLKTLDEPIAPSALKNHQAQANSSLELNLSKMERSQPGYHQLKHMIHNYPNHPLNKEWSWKKWTLEPNPELQLDEAQSFLKDPQKKELANSIILNLINKHEQSPWIYLNGCQQISKKADALHFKKLLDKHDDLEELLKIQHAYPNNELIKDVIQRKKTLLDLAYRGGRLAMISKQNARAVENFQKILLYGSGSEREQEVREAIERLNRLTPNTF
jgi:Zn-dependent protease with chaperone function